jgi:hypothetical protein
MDFLAMKNKYLTKSNAWIGRVLDASSLNVEDIQYDNTPWRKDSTIEASISNFKALKKYHKKYKG